MKRFVTTALAAAILAAPGLAFAQNAPDDRNQPRAEHQAPQQQRHDAGRAEGHKSAPTHAQPQHHQETHAQAQPQHRDWHRGDRFDRHYAPNYTRVVYVEHYGLRPPQPGYVWVRSGFDALLVQLSNNIVVSISPGVFH